MGDSPSCSSRSRIGRDVSCRRTIVVLPSVRRVGCQTHHTPHKCIDIARDRLCLQSGLRRFEVGLLIQAILFFDGVDLVAEGIEDLFVDDCLKVQLNIL